MTDLPLQQAADQKNWDNIAQRDYFVELMRVGATQSITNGAITVVDWDAIVSEEGPQLLTTNQRLGNLTTNLITVLDDGTYEVGFSGYWTATAAGARRVMQVAHLNKAGALIRYVLRDERGPNATLNAGATMSRSVRMNAGESVRAEVFQDSGAALGFVTDAPNGFPRFWLKRMGP